MMQAIETSILLPEDSDNALLVGRVWEPVLGGPTLCLLRDGALFDLSSVAPTMRDLLELEGLGDKIEAAGELRLIAALDDALMGSQEETAAEERLHLLAPCDLQAVKAAGVTFVASMLERVIEEQARGDASKAESIRADMTAIIGDDLSKIEPGSDGAARIKEVLLEKGAWSQYLEVGIGPDVEVFTKGQPMSSMGFGAQIGLHPKSTWNNPEPEVVLAVNSRGEIVGATLGNDVNLRDFEGRSALLLGKAKDNNASCSIGPFLRLFDGGFTLEDVCGLDLSMTIEGTDNYRLEAVSSMSKISRDPADIVSQTIGAHHQYPDGFMLFLGTMFAPTDDRDNPGQGFTHKIGDRVTISTPLLGALINHVNLSDRLPPWQFGTGALMRNLAKRGLLKD
ncbi:fumarylacetoacetate hydrolase family protein [Denitrobaculum tricleocarpae]|uniref:Fumarylacetoacetate hydrolase family protein n=1 Tax=Denitrobaculum tricleocarpae TaxID=2591009 RepID=A0A545TF59_9PROT|nr:fumarylacetoacetate hydrolase family protein [Denitrobaculum tricleocarpae]TQV75872.1 fumarylacetoacetate hydrolase family protein [Denitrobaculum tricleocarpae]